MYRKMIYLAPFVFVLGLAANVANADITSDLLGYYPLDEGVGTIAIDVSGNGHDGTLNNGVTWISPGFIGKGAINVDKTSHSRIELGTWNPAEKTGQLTLALWIRWAGEGTGPVQQGLIGKRDAWADTNAMMFVFQLNSMSTSLQFFRKGRYVSSPEGIMTQFIGEWAHVAVTFDGTTAKIYLNGEEIQSGGFDFADKPTANMGIGNTHGGGSIESFNGDIDEVRIYNRALGAWDIADLFEWKDHPPVKAANPSPPRGATDVPIDVVLGWEPGEFAAPTNGHKVYLGESFDDVNAATGGIAQTAVSYTPAQRLDFGKTYYWRVDEVNAPPNSHVEFKSSVWSFTTELFAYVIDHVVATASSSEQGKGYENTVNDSGLDAGGLLHGNIGEGTMWLSARDANQPTWIEFEFQSVQKVHEMWVWNSNSDLEQLIGLGFKDVTIEYSTDGDNFTTLGTTHEFAQAPGTADYAHDTTIDMGGVAAKYVRLTANSNWGDILEQFGLSEVRFFSIPVSARKPSPTSGATNVALDPVLGWTAGREAAGHNVYFSDDLQAVIEGTTPVTAVTETSYGPLSLDVGTTYYWRIDEVNDAEIPALWQGNIWDFATVDSLIVDDFENYDADNNQIWYAWKDGLGYGTPDTPPYYAGNGTGASVGDETTESFTEEKIVHGGNQSMPLAYDNNKQGYLNYSEATMTLDSQQDWTVRGVGELSLWFRGYPASVGSFVEEPVETYTMTAAGADIWNQADEFHYAFKQLTGVGSIVAKVESIDNTNSWAKAGVMIRETLDPGSVHAMMVVTPEQGISFQRRTVTNGASSNTDTVGITAPYWVKIERDLAGNFTAYSSADGSTWTVQGAPENIQMGAIVYIGLALTSHDVDLTCQAVFTNVTITGWTDPQWASQDIGIASNIAESLYVAVSNSAGVPAVVYHGDPAATNIGTWTEWVIPLRTIADQGINLSNVDKIAIGIGTQSNTTVPGGSGKMYFDDIRLYRPREAAEAE